ncbi:uncharacterized protein MONBRDRAFT_9157 [Monosiga brevicollis MX1]|uniref:Serine-threonine/tyrosine-protein kinase catalytic domain-containing protein n=1 Tax=Monosiga brevicollis TaxID=81824 RepID=A9V295_MONBE|nr:uncharacterized protein MONBRDRAFT_9157 [Monosiga brevicollis MX1]EDQ88337.1 predicted protein [Monosiga brevicollis MX1]|eukprot:XP_001746930.1 hypothetical protein [Monosiga brevicollis MX1]
MVYLLIERKPGQSIRWWHPAPSMRWRLSFLLLVLISKSSPARGENTCSTDPWASSSLLRRTFGPQTVLAVDVDSDGHTDLVTASYYNDQVAWFRNQGQGRFEGSLRIISDSNKGSRTLAVADLDNDGDLDLVVGSSVDFRISWYASNGSQYDAVPRVITTETRSIRDVVTADLDNDGYVDIISGSNDQNAAIFWYRNQQGSFSGARHVLDEDSPAILGVAAADFDNDNLTDVVAASESSNTVTWYRNLGNGSFSSRLYLTLNGAHRPVSVVAVDLNQDGRPDILCSTLLGRVIWFRNTGMGTFAPAAVVTTDLSSSRYATAADLDNDGWLDVIIAGYDNNVTAWVRNLGNDSFDDTTQLIDMNARGAHWIATADFDGDGRTDVAAACFLDSNVITYRNIDQGNFTGTRTVLSTTAQGTKALVAVDLDGDGHLDVASANYHGDSLTWYRNPGAGNFTGAQHVVTAYAAQPTALAAADIDNDGHPDLVSANAGHGQVVWYRNLGQGNFNPDPVIVAVDLTNTQAIFTVDLDGDADIDVITAGPGDATIAWYANIGNGSFSSSPIPISSPAVGASAVYAADLDNDGLVDVVSANSDDAKIAWYRNLGRGRFSSEHIISADIKLASAVTVADLDDDGWPDIICGGIEGFAQWFKNDQGAFGRGHIISTVSLDLRTIAVADMNKDGRLDIVTSNSFAVVWYRNAGQGVFDQDYILAAQSFDQTRAIVADLSGDGYPDVVCAHFNSSDIRWLLNDLRSPPRYIHHPARDDRDALIQTSVLGKGNFGTVFRASDYKAVMLEAALLHIACDHPHIVSLIAIVHDSAPISLVLELADLGDLRTYLRHTRVLPHTSLVRHFCAFGLPVALEARSPIDTLLLSGLLAC